MMRMLNGIQATYAQMDRGEPGSSGGGAHAPPSSAAVEQFLRGDVE